MACFIFHVHPLHHDGSPVTLSFPCTECRCFSHCICHFATAQRRVKRDCSLVQIATSLVVQTLGCPVVHYFACMNLSAFALKTTFRFAMMKILWLSLLTRVWFDPIPPLDVLRPEGLLAADLVAVRKIVNDGVHFWTSGYADEVQIPQRRCPVPK